MAPIKKTPSGMFQLCVKNKLLPKTLWATFDTYELTEQYGTQLERLLGQGHRSHFAVRRSHPSEWPGP